MKLLKIDLYEYFNMPKTNTQKAILTCYLKDEFVDNNLVHYNPAMLVIAGGGYEAVSKRSGEPIALQFLAKGYNAFSLDYSVAPNKFPTCLVEASMAMVYIRKNAEQLFINKDSVCALGCSAGGHLVGLLSTAYNHESLEFLKKYGEEIKPNAVIYGYPVISGVDKPHLSSFKNLLGEVNDNLLREFSINERVDKNTPPAFIFTTANDKIVPCKNSLLLALAYEKQDVPFSLHVFTKGNHGLSVGDETILLDSEIEELKGTYSIDFKCWIDMAINFLKDIGFKRLEKSKK